MLCYVLIQRYEIKMTYNRLKNLNVSFKNIGYLLIQFISAYRPLRKLISDLIRKMFFLRILRTKGMNKNE